LICAKALRTFLAESDSRGLTITVALSLVFSAVDIFLADLQDPNHTINNNGRLYFIALF
jgi:hypothetical protein